MHIWGGGAFSAYPPLVLESPSSLAMCHRASRLQVGVPPPPVPLLDRRRRGSRPLHLQLYQGGGFDATCVLAGWSSPASLSLPRRGGATAATPSTSGSGAHSSCLSGRGAPCGSWGTCRCAVEGAVWGLASRRAGSGRCFRICCAPRTAAVQNQPICSGLGESADSPREFFLVTGTVILPP